MALSGLRRRLSRFESRLQKDKIATFDLLLSRVSFEDRQVLTRSYPGDVIPAADVARFRAALVNLLWPATDRQRRVLADVQEWIDEHEDAEAPAVSPGHLAGVGDDRSHIIPGGIRIFDSAEYETEEELEAAIEAHRQEYGLDLDIRRGGKGRATVVIVRHPPDHRPQPEPEPVKVSQERLSEETEPEPKLVEARLPKRAKRKRRREPKPKPEPKQPELTASQKRRQRRLERFERWKRGEDTYP